MSTRRIGRLRRITAAGAVFISSGAMTVLGFGSIPLAAAAAPITAAEALALHSNPGADKVIFLDFDGTTVPNDYWNGENGPTTIPGWNPSNDGPSFSPAEAAAIQKGWALVAEVYSPWDVDVTTEDPGAAALNRADASDTKYGIHVVFTSNTDVRDAACGPDAAGCASGNMNDIGQAPIAWVFNASLTSGAGSAPHEIGHLLGLSHDGTSTSDYSEAYGDWAAIMGHMGGAIIQFSKGDYPDANNHQDDLAIIGTYLPVRTDEAPTAPGSAVALPSSKAYITSQNDADSYILGRCTAGANVTVTPTTPAPSLDVEARLYSPQGTLLKTVNPPSTSQATMAASYTIGTAGTDYVLQVRGGSYSDWNQGGWDNYGSIGSYSVTVTGCDGQNSGTTPVTFDSVLNYAVNDLVEVDLSAVDDADDAADIVTRYTIGTEASPAADPRGSGTVYDSAHKPVLHDGEYIRYSSEDTDGHQENPRNSATAQIATRLLSTPRISAATNQVGETVTAAIPTVSPAGATVTYQWQRRASATDAWTPIGSDSATRTYTLGTADIGSEISVKATVHAAGFKSAWSASLPSAPVVATGAAAADNFGGPVVGHFGTAGSGNGQFNMARNIAVDKAGSVYVIDEFNSRVQKFTAAGDWLDTWNYPAGPATTDGLDHGLFDGIDVGPNGHVYVFDHNNNRVLEYDPYGHLVTSFAAAGVRGLQIDADGNFYTADPSGVFKYAPDGTLLAHWGTYYHGNNPGDVQFDWPVGTVVSNGLLYVLDEGNNRIQVLNATTGAFVKSISGSALGSTLDFWGLRDIETDAAGNFYVLMGAQVPGMGTGEMVIKKFDANFALLTTYKTGDAAFGFTFALGADGQTYVAGWDGNVGLTPAAHLAPVVPSEVKVIRDGTGAVVKWAASPDVRRRPITSYIITATPVTAGHSIVTKTVEAWAPYGDFIDGLDQEISYTFTVTATNADGNSAPSNNGALFEETTTTLTVTGTKLEGDPLTLTAHVTPSGAAGLRVDFKDGAEVIGSGPAVGGTASISVSNLAAEGHALTSTFVPVDENKASESTSDRVFVEITPKTVAFPKTAKVGKPSGKAKIGKKLTAAVSGWPSGTKFTYQWRANGKAIKGATAKTFKLTKKQRGTVITLAVTATKAGYVKTTKVSPKTARVTK